MKFEIYGKSHFSFELTRQQLGVLMTLSANHYDFDCRAMSKPGQQGVLHGWSAARNDEPFVEVHGATFRDLDLCTKLLEAFNVAPLPEHDAIIARGLEADFRVALTQSQAIVARWTAKIDTPAATSTQKRAIDREQDILAVTHDFAEEHLAALAADVLIWKRTGDLPDDAALRTLGDMFQRAGFAEYLQHAETVVARVALEQAASQTEVQVARMVQR